MATKIKFLDFLTMFPCSVTRLGIFLISWDKIFSQHQPKYLMTFWAFLKYTTLEVKIALAIFCATFGKLGLICIPTSGHTVS